MNQTDFLHIVLEKRILAPADFTTWITEQEEFDNMVKYVLGNNTKWAEKSGLNKPKEKEVTGLSPKELQWKKFFQTHTFDGSLEQRRFADAFSIVEGIELTRFLKLDKPAVSDRFAPHITIVPIGNSNEHNYKIGEPAYCYTRGTCLLRSNGTTGNSMSTYLTDYRMADGEETTKILISLMIRSGSLAETLISSLMD